MAGEVKLKLAIEGGKVVGAELDGVTSRLGGMEKAAGATGNMLSGLQSKVLALSGTFATLLSVQKAVMAADAVTTLKNQLDLATGSAQRAAQAYDELFAIAQRSRVSFTELGATFASISRAGQELGISQDRLLTVTQAIGQAMTIGGGSAQGMQAALTQLGQGLASGTLRGEELNSVMEQAPRLAKALADGMNVPIGKLREMGAAGEITAQQVIAALEKSAPQLAREVEGATLTVGQAFTVLQNDVVKFVGDADKATGASAALAQAMVTLSGGVRSLGGFIREHETAFAVLSTALGSAAVAAGIYATVTAIGALTGAVGVLSAALMANPILLTLGGIAAGVGALIAAQKAYAGSAQGMAFEVADLTQRIQKANTVLEKTQGDDKLTAGMRARVAAMETRRKELQGILAVQEAESLDTRAEDARLAQHTQQIKAQTQAEADLAKLRQEMSGVPESYVKKMEEVIRLNQAGLLVGKEYTDMLGQMQAKLVKKTGTLSDAAKGLNLYNDLTAQGNGLNADFAEKWALLTAAYKGGTITLAQLTDAQAKLLAQQSFAREQVKALEEEKKKEAQATADGAQAYAKYLESLDQATAALAKEVQGQTDHVARMGLSKQAIAELDAARLEEQATILDGIAIKRMDRNLDEAEYNALKEQARLKRELARLAREGASKEAAQDLEKESQKAAEKAAADWARSAEKIESSITDALMRGFESGKSFAENLRDVVVNMFKTMVLRPVVEMTVRSSMSILGMGGNQGGAGVMDMLGATNDASSAFNGLSQLGGLSGWLTNFGESAANGIIKAGEMAYQAGFEKIGSSMMSLSEAGNFSAVADGLNMVGDGLGYLNAAMSASEGKWGKAIGQAVGTYIGGPIGAAIGGAIGGWVDDAFSGGHEYTVGTGISGRFSGGNFSGRNYQDWRNDGSSGFFGIGASGSSSGTNYSAMDSGLQKSMGAAYGSILAQTADFAKTLGASTSSITGFQKDIRLALGADAEANKKAIADMFKGIANDVAATVLDAQYIREGEGAADTLARLATNLTVVNGSLDTLGDSLLPISQFSGDAASALVDMFGGMSQYQTAIGAYYQRFYSDEERIAKTHEQLGKQFADLGLALPDNTEAFRDLVNAQDLNTEAGRKTYATLIGLSGAFADVSESSAEAAKQLINAARFSTYAEYAAASAAVNSTPTPRFAAGGFHAGGLRLVGENGPELEATGPSRIWNQSQMAGALMAGSGELVSSINAMRDDMRAQARALATLYSRMVKQLESWDAKGMPEVRTL